MQTNERKLPQLLTINEVVEITKINRYTLYRLIKLGELPYIKIGKKYFIPEEIFLTSQEKNDNIS